MRPFPPASTRRHSLPSAEPACASHRGWVVPLRSSPRVVAHEHNCEANGCLCSRRPRSERWPLATCKRRMTLCRWCGALRLDTRALFMALRRKGLHHAVFRSGSDSDCANQESILTSLACAFALRCSALWMGKGQCTTPACLVLHVYPHTCWRK